MDVAATLAEARSLSIDDRLRLVEGIWDSILTDTDGSEATPAERALIEKRLAAYLARPERGRSLGAGEGRGIGARAPLTLSVILSLEARADFDEALNWYEQQRAGLGESFSAHMQDAFDQIAERPELYAPLAENVRRARVRTFPYLIFYRVETDRIAVLAIIHGSRDQDVWHERL